MAKQAEIVSRWIDAQPEGALLRSLDLEHLVNRDQASRQLVRLARHGRLRRVARGMYVAVTASRFGPVPPPADKLVQSLARITGHAIVRHGAAAASALGLTTQVPVRQIYLTDGRARPMPASRCAASPPLPSVGHHEPLAVGGSYRGLSSLLGNTTH